MIHTAPTTRYFLYSYSYYDTSYNSAGSAGQESAVNTPPNEEGKNEEEKENAPSVENKEGDEPKEEEGEKKTEEEGRKEEKEEEEMTTKIEEEEKDSRDEFKGGFTRYFKIVPSKVPLGGPAIFMQLSRMRIHEG